MVGWGVMVAGGIVVRHSGNSGIGCCHRDWQAAQLLPCAATTQTILTMIGAVCCGSAGSALTAALP